MKQKLRTSPPRVSLLIAVGLAAVLTGIPSSAGASLGGDASTVTADRVHAQAALVRTAQLGAYSFQEIRSAAGVTVREYMSGTGNVFAVTWTGPFQPDLQQVLGSYYPRYLQEVQQRRQTLKSRGPITIQDPDFVVQAGGHQRGFGGRAYLPALMPQGVAIGSIQ